MILAVDGAHAATSRTSISSWRHPRPRRRRIDAHDARGSGRSRPTPSETAGGCSTPREALFRERGLDVGVAEIAAARRRRPRHAVPQLPDQAGPDRGDRGRADGRGHRPRPEAARRSGPGEALFEFLEEIVGRQQLDRSLFEAVADAFLANDEIRAAHAEIVGVLDELLDRAQDAGAVRADVGAMDVLMLFKGVCEAASAFAQLDAEHRPAPARPGPGRDQRGPGAAAAARPAPTLEDVERVVRKPSEPTPAVKPAAADTGRQAGGAAPEVKPAAPAR